MRRNNFLTICNQNMKVKMNFTGSIAQNTVPLKHLNRNKLRSAKHVFVWLIEKSGQFFGTAYRIDFLSLKGLKK